MWFLWKSFPSLSQKHRIAEVGSDLWRSPSPALLLKAGQLKQTAQGHFLLGFEYLWGWLIQQPVGQSALVFDCPHSKNSLLFLWLHGISCISVCASFSLDTTKKSLAPPSLLTPFTDFICIDKHPPKPSLLANQFQLSHSLLRWEMFPFLNHSSGASLDLCWYVHVSLVLGSPKLDPAFQM